LVVEASGLVVALPAERALGIQDPCHPLDQRLPAGVVSGHRRSPSRCGRRERGAEHGATVRLPSPVCRSPHPSTPPRATWPSRRRANGRTGPRPARRPTAHPRRLRRSFRHRPRRRNWPSRCAPPLWWGCTHSCLIPVGVVNSGQLAAVLHSRSRSTLLPLLGLPLGLLGSKPVAHQ